MDTSAITAAAKASSASYRSFADATRAVLDLIERHMPDATLFLAHLDRGQFIHRVVDARKGGEFGLRSNLATPLGDAFCSHMAEDRAPRVCDDLGRHPVYKGLAMQQRMEAASYLGVPLELSDGTRVGSLAALSREFCAFEPADEQLFTMLARVLASELERESNERDLRRFNEMLRDQARGMGGDVVAQPRRAVVGHVHVVGLRQRQREVRAQAELAAVARVDDPVDVVAAVDVGQEDGHTGHLLLEQVEHGAGGVGEGAVRGGRRRRGRADRPGLHSLIIGHRLRGL